MMDITLSVLAVIGGALTLELFTPALAALGFVDEDEPRFRLHAQASETTEEFLAGNPS